MFFAALAALCMAVACDPNIDPLGPGNNNVDSKLVFEKEASSQPFEFTASGSWEFVSAPKWVTVSPTSGSAGKATITVACTYNDTADDRSGVIYIKDTKADGDVNVINVSVYQYCGDVFDIPVTEYFVSRAGGTVTVKVGVNNYYDVKSECDWIVFADTKDITYDELKFEVAPNEETTPRTGYVTISTEEISQKIAFTQAGADFFKVVMGMRATGTWCGYCPALGHDVARAFDELDGRFVYASFYAERGYVNNPNTYLDFKNLNSVMNTYSMDGFPSLAMDNRGKTGNYGVGNIFKIISNFVNECVESYPAHTGIDLAFKLEDDKLVVDAGVYCTAGDDYTFNLILLEDGIVADQHDYQNIYEGERNGVIPGYVHNRVSKCFVTPFPAGEPCTMEDGTVKNFHYSIDIPSNVLNKDNLSVVAYVTRPRTDSDNVAGVKNVDYMKLKNIVDNAAKCKIGEHTALRYEE